ncbi:CNTN4 [Mytilus coruscus]|uniref:CNTN4 n=1 Tax=Mytilus coruscus TaxID=42192 RepID=A0A6J8AM68_MYTCO|nr:CNTN4 [Mytilus coruscus]
MCFVAISIVKTSPIETGECAYCSINIYEKLGSVVNLKCQIVKDEEPIVWIGPPNQSLYAVGPDIIPELLSFVSVKEFDNEPPTNISIYGHNSQCVVFGFVDQQVNLTCEVETGKPPELMQWEYEHEIVAIGGPVSLTYTFIPDVTHHLKAFKCIVTNNVTRTELTDKVMLYLYLEPTATIGSGQTINIVEDETLHLQCNYTSNDINNTSITWKYPSDYQIKRIKDNETFILDHIERTDTGKYTCVVSNSAGKANDTVLVNVIFEDSYENSFLIDSPELNITFEDKKTNKFFKCNANGNPDDYEFSAWEHKTEYGDHIRYLNDNGAGTLKLNHWPGETDRHHDQGLYICNVSNGVLYDGEMNQMANFTLKQKGFPYFVTDNKKIQYGTLGKDTNLTLNVVSYPIMKTVNIYKTHHIMMANSNYWFELSKIEDIVYGTRVNVKGYKLFIPIKANVIEDFMIYTVAVTNEYGHSNISVDYRFARPPRAPRDLRAVALDDIILVKWTADFFINLHQTFFVEYRKHSESSWSRVSVEEKSTVLINGLEKDTIYLLRMYAETMYGESDKTDDIIIKTDSYVNNEIRIDNWGAAVNDGFMLVWIERGSSSHRNEETSARQAHYDEINSMYYNPINNTISHRVTRNNHQQEIRLPLNANLENNEANSSSSQIIPPCTLNQFKLSKKSNSPRSSSDESYLVPCRNYIDFDIEMVNENEQHRYIDTEPEINVDESSISSINSETNIKIIRRYKTLNVSDINEHCYKKYNEIEVSPNQ